jgi:hypothetical protein
MRKFSSFFLTAMIFIMTVTGCGNKKSTWPIALDHVKKELQASFNRMDSLAAALSAEIAEYKADSAMVRNILMDGYGSVKGVYENCFITPEGTLKIIAPKDFHKVEGSDIRYQDHIIRINETKKPVLSSTFRAVEGFRAVALAYPILSDKNELLGITVLLIQPDAFLRDIVSREMSGVPADIWVMQKDGIILYDFDELEIGRNLFTDPSYSEYSESLRTTAGIMDENEGTAVFDFRSDSLDHPASNRIYWVTIQMSGMDWKIVLVNPIGTHAVHRSADALGLKSAPQKLFELSSDDTFLTALASGDRETVDGYFKEFYDEYPIYAIEWVDSTVTTRFGYPAVHSLENHQITPDIPEQRAFYDAVVNRKETTIEMRLLEGNSGIFRLCPVTFNDQNLGSIYYLIINR